MILGCWIPEKASDKAPICVTCDIISTPGPISFDFHRSAKVFFTQALPLFPFHQT
jgi:hypothetical protein